MTDSGCAGERASVAQGACLIISITIYLPINSIHSLPWVNTHTNLSFLGERSSSVLVC